jgi:hypothetical protein
MAQASRSRQQQITVHQTESRCPKTPLLHACCSTSRCVQLFVAFSTAPCCSSIAAKRYLWQQVTAISCHATVCYSTALTCCWLRMARHIEFPLAAVADGRYILGWGDSRAADTAASSTRVGVWLAASDGSHFIGEWRSDACCRQQSMRDANAISNSSGIGLPRRLDCQLKPRA